MKRFTTRLWAVLMLMLVSLQTMGTETFNNDRTDFRDESIYFMMTTRFYDGDPSNNVLCWDNQAAQIETKDPCWRGDFQGVIDKLDYIKALGFTAIWITPVVQNASGYDYHGYHASDFSKVDCRYQSGDGKKSGDVMFQELIDKAHAKGIKIILDIVLNHTGNFGEEHFCKEFDRDTRLRNQADINACMIPTETLGSDYPTLQPGFQYQRRLAMMKNTDGQNHDPHNYWHHFGNFNWDLPNRWWAQIAGDCVDLNTENNTVAEYLVKCYGNFIKMGVDGFRIDTSGHISRLTFCKQFIPQFAALGKQYEDKRLNKAPFFMYGEVCARFGSVQYRGQDNLSPYYYTWKAPQNLMDQFDGSQSYWDTQELYDSGTGYDAKLMPLCEKDNADSPESNNTFMLNGAWHEPDYSQSSGFNVIDFPLHYNFSNAGSAYGLAKSGDMKYNDATFNVVYVDSHDYGPQPSDGIRFSGSDAQWAENLSLMFTFRGIPCLYYGSEVGFRRGSVIDKGPNGPLSNTGRAYFGGYITGDVEASDFGVYKASGNVAASLNHDLAQHLIRLNKIRQAVPALRKGQWTDEGCKANGGIAFKRAYKDSYALVALNGGATFTDCPAGTYTDLVTGKTYPGPTITVDAPHNQGQVRVLVKDWTGGKLIDDGAFIYETAAQHKSDQDYDGNQEAGTTWVDDAPLQPVSVSLSPAGGSFRTNTVTVTATLSGDAKSGWYQIEGQDKVNLTPGEATTFTIGEDMDFKQTKTVTWSATSSEGKEKTGKVTYTKVDPNATITVTVKADKAPYIHAWITGGNNLTGAWPGKVMNGPEEIDGAKYWSYSFDGVEKFNVILNNGGNGAQSGDITGIDSDIYLEYDGGSSAKKIDAPVNTGAKVTLSPNGGDFQKTISVTATLSNNAKSGWYKIGDGEQVAFTPGKAATFTLGADMMEGESKTVTWSATNTDNETKTGSATFNKIKEVVIPTPTGIFAYFLAPAEWSDIHVWAWNDADNFTGGTWPGVSCTKTDMKKNGLDVWMWKFDGDLTGAPTNIIFNNNGNGVNQTETFTFVNGAVYDRNGKTNAFVNGAVYDRNGKTNESVSTGINQVGSKKAPAKLKIYSINGVKVAEVNKVSDAEYVLAPGMYICNGKKFVIK